MKRVINYLNLAVKNVNIHRRPQLFQSNLNNHRKHSLLNGVKNINNTGFLSVSPLNLYPVNGTKMIKRGVTINFDLVKYEYKTLQKNSDDTPALSRFTDDDGVKANVNNIKAKNVHLYFLFNAEFTNDEKRFKSIFYFGVCKNMQDRLMKHRSQSEKTNRQKYLKFHGANKIGNIGICSVYFGSLSSCIKLESTFIKHGVLLGLDLVNIRHSTPLENSVVTILLQNCLYRTIRNGPQYVTEGLSYSDKTKESLREYYADPLTGKRMREQILTSFHSKSQEVKALIYKRNAEYKRQRRLSKKGQKVVKPRGSWQLFGMRHSERYDLQFATAKKLSDYWRNLNAEEKEYWKKQAEEDRKRYNAEMKALEENNAIESESANSIGQISNSGDTLVVQKCEEQRDCDR